MGTHIALLRGINVGGKNVIKMAALKACFEQMGFEDVVTYIQSGNVVFTASGAASVRKKIEAGLSDAFGYDASVVLRTKKELVQVLASAPKGFGTDPEAYRYDVMFLKEPLTPKAALAQVKARAGVDTVDAGPGVLYFSRLIAKATQSQLPKLTSQPVYQQMTIRNWNTTSALLDLMS